MTEIRIPVPRLPRGLGANLAGLLGLVAVALAIGGLTGNWWWSALLGGLFAVGLSYVAQTHAAAAEADVTVPVAAQAPRLVSAAKSA
ncbi:MAG: hypothetical protein JWO11_4420 [Nocardioides sp.]|nr:hypothetical protein [Nocardioides sp.]